MRVAVFIKRIENITQPFKPMNTSITPNSFSKSTVIQCSVPRVTSHISAFTLGALQHSEETDQVLVNIVFL